MLTLSNVTFLVVDQVVSQLLWSVCSVVVVRVFRSMRVNIELDHATHVRFSPDCRQVTSLNI